MRKPKSFDSPLLAIEISLHNLIGNLAKVEEPNQLLRGMFVATSRYHEQIERTIEEEIQKHIGEDKMIVECPSCEGERGYDRHIGNDCNGSHYKWQNCGACNGEGILVVKAPKEKVNNGNC